MRLYILKLLFLAAFLSVRIAYAQVIMCPGASTAIIYGPQGFMSYSWTPPITNTLSQSQSTMSTITINNPVVGTIFTLQAIGTNSTIQTFTFNITASPVFIHAIASSPSCSNGTSGSATVGVSGGTGTYSYTWLNSTNSVVGTASIAVNLSAGTYSVIASGNSPCGSDTATVNVGVSAGVQYYFQLKPYCGSEAYLCAGAGSNFQWYNNVSAISAPVGTAQCFTVSNPTNGAIFHVRYNSVQGCQDSLKFYLWSTTPGNLGIQSSTYACQGSANGSVVINLTPATGSPGGQNSFSVFSTGTLNPVYSASLAAGFQNSFGLVNLPASTYSISAFDGICKYTNTFSIVHFPDTFTLTPNSVTLCTGQAVAAGITFTSPPSPGQYSYSWSPNLYIPGNNQQFTIILPALSPGTFTSIIYTVVVTPSVINCPISKTLSLVAGHPLPPAINPIPLLCQNSSGYTINASPSGGTFSSALINGQSLVGSLSGVITTSLAPIGTNTFSYSAGIGTCVASSTGSYQISGPQLTVSPFINLCMNQTATLQAGGATSYTWSNGSFTYSTAVSPIVNTTYSVIGATSNNTCTSIQTVSVQLLALPTISVSGNQSICNFQSATLTASGAASYLWNNGMTGSSCVVQPSTSSVFTVFGTSALGCVNSNTFLVHVNYGPLLQVQGNTLVCKGEPVTLIALGANSYTWAWNQGSYNPTITMIPSATLVYTLSGLSFTNPCTSQIQHTVFIDACIGDVEAKDIPFEINLYPNPSSGLVFIESGEETEIEVFNYLRQMVLQKRIFSGKHSIDLTEQAAGVYFINCKTNGISQVVRLVKLD